MKKFIGHIVVLGLALALSMGFIFSKADGNADAFYLKFTTNKQTNLILGTSKTAQGLQPESLLKTSQIDFYNYAFAMYASPYGKVYLESIKKKLDTDSKNQTFILAVDPWSLSSTTENPNDSLKFREHQSYLAAISNPNQKINLQYLFNYFDESYYKILTKNHTAFLHGNGWLEVTLPKDSFSVARRKNFTISGYQKKVNNYRFSDIRYGYLLKTIEYLKNYGNVHLVRLPVHPELMDLENLIISNFNLKMQKAIHLSMGYLDLSNENANFQYTDGVHLTKESGHEVSKRIGAWLQK